MDTEARKAAIDRPGTWRVANVRDRLHAWKCWRCGRTLARLSLLPGCAVEIKCGSCGAMNTAAVQDKQTA